MGSFHVSALAQRTLITRGFLLFILFALELIVISVQLDGNALTGAAALAGAIRDWGPYILRAIVGFAAIFATFLWLQHRPALDRISTELTEVPIRWTLLGAHLVTIAAFAALSARLYGGAAGDKGSWLAAGWLMAG